MRNSISKRVAANTLPLTFYGNKRKVTRASSICSIAFALTESSGLKKRLPG